MKHFIFPFITIIFFTTQSLGNNGVSDYVKDMMVEPSPQSSQFMRYGEYPVCPATGIPQIEIPIYTVKCDGIELPISISYHAGGIKVAEMGSTVGLGWTLNAGGAISRTILGGADFWGVSTDSPEYYFPYPTEDSVWTLIEEGKHLDANLLYRVATDKWHINKESDKYFYSFCGKSGSFRYCSTNHKIITIPYSTISIERLTHKDSLYYKDNKLYCVPSDTLTHDIYKIVDNDGTQYYFECADSTCSVPQYTIGWYLTKIITPTVHDTILISYCSSEYEICKHTDSFLNGSLHNFCTKAEARGDFADYTPLLKDATKSQAEAIMEEYFHKDIRKTRVDLGKKRLLEIEERDYQVFRYRTPIIKSIKWRDDSIVFNYEADRFEATYKNPCCNETLQKERLSSIRIYAGEDVLRTVSFHKSNLGISGSEGCRTLLSGICIYGNNPQNGENYSFEYNSGILPEMDESCSDFWGYYNGNGAGTRLYPRKMMDGTKPINDNIYYGGNRFPNPEFAQNGILTSVSYPTGGKTEFEYESNIISDLTNAPISWGGLRIKSISNLQNDTLVKKEVYQYSSGQASLPLGIEYAELFAYKIDYYYYANRTTTLNSPVISGPYTINVASGSPHLPISGWTGYPAFYPKVRKSVYNSKGTLLSTTTYNYELDKDVRSRPIGDMRLIPRVFSLLYNYDQGTVSPILISQHDSLFNNKGILVSNSSLENQYELVDMDDCVVGVKFGLDVELIDTNGRLEESIQASHPIWNFVKEHTKYFNVYAVPSFRRLKKSSVTADGITTETTFHYDSELRTLQPTRKEVTRTGGIVHTISYLYPFQSDNSVHLSMYGDGHYVDKVVGSQEFLDGQLTSRTQDEYVLKDGMFLLSAKQYSIGVSPLQTRLKVLAYDPFGNIQEVVQDDAIYTFFVWGYNHQYPVIKVDCPTECEANVAKVVSQYARSYKTGLEAGSEMTIEMLAGYIKNAGGRVSKYKYKPLVGLIEVTDDKGIKTTYTYDDKNRLSGVYDTNGHLVESYEYNYQNK